MIHKILKFLALAIGNTPNKNSENALKKGKHVYIQTIGLTQNVEKEIETHNFSVTLLSIFDFKNFLSRRFS
jgi:hypothetical protein